MTMVTEFNSHGQLRFQKRPMTNMSSPTITSRSTLHPLAVDTNSKAPNLTRNMKFEANNFSKPFHRFEIKGPSSSPTSIVKLSPSKFQQRRKLHFDQENADQLLSDLLSDPVENNQEYNNILDFVLHNNGFQGNEESANALISSNNVQNNNLDSVFLNQSSSSTSNFFNQLNGNEFEEFNANEFTNNDVYTFQVNEDSQSTCLDPLFLFSDCPSVVVPPSDEVDVDQTLYTLFLQNLNKVELAEETDEEDYNDEREEKDREEFRNDMGVRVSEKELLELLADNDDDESTEVNYTVSEGFSPFPFTIEQLECLKHQINQHTQLLIQVYCMAGYLLTCKGIKAEAYQYLAEFSFFKRYSRIDKDVLFENPIKERPKCFNFAPTIKSIEYEKVGAVSDEQIHEFMQRNDLEKSLFDTELLSMGENLPMPSNVTSTIFSHPPMNPLVYILLLESTSSIQYNPPGVILFNWTEKVEKKKVAKIESFPPSVEKLMEPFLPLFDPTFVPKIICDPILRVKFFPFEDELLVMGLRRYGTNQWRAIGSRYLPVKTENQIENRYRNLSSRRSPQNPIKDFYFEHIKPITGVEKELLVACVDQYGENFTYISNHFFKGVPASVLKKYYDQLISRTTNEKEIPDKIKSLSRKVNEANPDNRTLVQGKVVMWTKEEDRIILNHVRLYQAVKSTWELLSTMIQKSALQIESRYTHLMALFEKRNNKL